METFVTLWLSMLTVITCVVGFRISRRQQTEEEADIIRGGNLPRKSTKTLGLTVLVVFFMGIPVWCSVLFGGDPEKTEQEQLDAAIALIADSDTLFTVPGDEDDYIILPVDMNGISNLTYNDPVTKLNYDHPLYEGSLLIRLTRMFPMIDTPKVD